MTFVSIFLRNNLYLCNPLLEKAIILKIRLTLFFLLIVLHYGSAQKNPKNYFRAPLDIPMYLSGNFGELRSNHYHSGIDIKTKGRAGFNVYATADGFVSRVKVSGYGYGNAIYIDHPNGYTTVYAHLKQFSPKIDSIVKTFQYGKESFAIDEILSKNKIRVKKGEVIAKSGNTGSSGGPHLHFEIRETQSEFPCNPLLYGFDIKDNVAPVIRSLFIYPLSASSKVAGGMVRKQYNLTKNGDVYSIANNEVPLVSGKIGFALDVRDYMNATHNYYGIYSLNLYVDNELKHSFTLSKFSFGESRYINAHIDYEMYKTQKRRVHKLFQEQNQEESFAAVVNRGINFTDTKKHEVRVVISDAYGNETNLEFSLQSERGIFSQTKEENLLYCEEQNNFQTKGFFARVPAFTFYKNIEREGIVKKSCERKDSYSPLFHILSETVPLHKGITVGIAPKNLPSTLRDKAFVARENKGRYHFIGNNWESGFLTGKTKKVGDFVVLVDTNAPKIQLWKGSSYRKTGKLRYRITDNLSGISSFRGTIDGKWVLFEYDPKRNLLWHTLTSKRIVKGRKHKLILEVTDACGNKAVRETSFDW